MIPSFELAQSILREVQTRRPGVSFGVSEVVFHTSFDHNGKRLRVIGFRNSLLQSEPSRTWRAAFTSIVNKAAEP